MHKKILLSYLMFLQRYYRQICHQSKFPSIICWESTHRLLAVCFGLQVHLLSFSRTSLSVQQVYLYLLCPRASLSSRLKPWKNSLLPQWTSGYLSNYSLLFIPGGPVSPFFLEGLRCPYFLVGLEAHAWWPSNPRLPLSPLIALRPCLIGTQNTVG